jgi:hypothetical protein
MCMNREHRRHIASRKKRDWKLLHFIEENQYWAPRKKAIFAHLPSGLMKYQNVTDEAMYGTG